ncbi:MAG TPA: CAP domain-containing protein, partial [Verrucomicrobiae bacterium]|nr:CAP domain-containing protein [Verrucomicrobiae bacterium]
MLTQKDPYRLTASLVFFLLFPSLCFGQISIGEAAKAPKLPPAPQPAIRARTDVTVTGGFNVNTDSREQTRTFYNGIYPTSANVPMYSTADVPNCTPGTNSTAFVEAVLRRINWFRAMAGMPAAITFNPTYNEEAQQMAVMISANHELNHNPPTNWSCYTAEGANASGGNQAEGFNGADAITGYIWDFGVNNNEVGHRRWILLPQTQVMGTGDVPASSDTSTNYAAANSTYVFDSSINSPRPATRKPYVSWPPEGYVPYQVVYPYWSFALSNANVSAATVTMKSNNVNVAVNLQPQVNGYGENTLVWVPMGLDATQQGTAFPFNGTDTVYSVTVSNIAVVNGNTTNEVSFAYNVTVFDPAVTGTDYVPPVINGPSQPIVGAGNVYSCAAINNPNVTSYEWIISKLIPGNLADDANNGLNNFILSPAPDYSVITNSPDGTGSNCFHLCHDNATSQFMQVSEVFCPATNSALTFQSLIGFATGDESARVQASTDGGNTWQDLYVQYGCDNGPTNMQCESTFTPHTISLSAFAAQPTLLRFNWAYTGGGYYPETDNYIGWSIKNIVVTNVNQMINT